MYDKLWLIPFFPLLGSVINGLLGKKIKNEKVIGGIGTGMMVLSFVVSCKYVFPAARRRGKGHQITRSAHGDRNLDDASASCTSTGASSSTPSRR